MMQEGKLRDGTNLSIFNKLSKRCPWLIVNTFVDREDNDFIRKFPAMLTDLRRQIRGSKVRTY